MSRIQAIQYLPYLHAKQVNATLFHVCCVSTSHLSGQVHAHPNFDSDTTTRTKSCKKVATRTESRSLAGLLSECASTYVAALVQTLVSLFGANSLSASFGQLRTSNQETIKTVYVEQWHGTSPSSLVKASHKRTGFPNWSRPLAKGVPKLHKRDAFAGEESSIWKKAAALDWKWGMQPPVWGWDSCAWSYSIYRSFINNNNHRFRSIVNAHERVEDLSPAFMLSEVLPQDTSQNSANPALSFKVPKALSFSKDDRSSLQH